MDTNGGGKLDQIYLSEEKRVAFISATDVVIKKIHNMKPEECKYCKGHDCEMCDTTPDIIEEKVAEEAIKICARLDNANCVNCSSSFLESIEFDIKQALTTIYQQGVLSERERIEAVLKAWIPTDYKGYGVNLPSKGMHLDDHKRNFAKSILEVLTP